jgi:transcriptional regulator with XRE-family HTH domain
MLPESLQFRLPTARDIERLAFEANVTIEALCKRAGISSQTFRNWKFGRGSPSLDRVQSLLAAGIAMHAETQGAAVARVRSHRKPAAKPPAPKRGARTKAAAAKRSARRPA